MARQPEVRYINHYVSGTLAYQPEKKTQHKQKAQLPKVKPQQKLRICVDPLAVCGLVVAFTLMIMMLVGFVQWNQARTEAAVMRDYVASLEAENAQLQNTYTSGYDPEEIRNIALNMGMIPAEQAQHIQMQVVVPQPVEEPTAWASFWAFILGMFA